MQNYDPIAHSRNYVRTLQGVLERLPHEEIGKMLIMLDEARRAGATVFVAGNGGSSATASHMANDLLKTVTKGGGPGIRTIALTDNVPLITAIGNDISYAEIFSYQLQALARPGDLVIAITGSGNSPNIVRVLETARSMGLRSIGLLGMGGGKCASLADVVITVPSDDYGPIEDAHMFLNHLATAYFIEQGRRPR